jgi:hypothetical protein
MSGSLSSRFVGLGLCVVALAHGSMTEGTAQTMRWMSEKNWQRWRASHGT